MKTIENVIKTLIKPVDTVLNDHVLVFAIAGFLTAWLVARDPALSGQANNLETIGLIITGLVVGGYKLEDIAQAVANRPATVQAGEAQVIAALPTLIDSGTQTVDPQNTVIDARPVFPPTNPALSRAAIEQITAPPPPRAGLPDTGYVQPPTVKSVAAPQGDPTAPKSDPESAAAPGTVG